MSDDRTRPDMKRLVVCLLMALWGLFSSWLSWTSTLSLPRSDDVCALQADVAEGNFQQAVMLRMDNLADLPSLSLSVCCIKETLLSGWDGTQFRNVSLCCFLSRLSSGSPTGNAIFVRSCLVNGSETFVDEVGVLF